MTPGPSTHDGIGISVRSRAALAALATVAVGTMILSGCAAESTAEPEPSETSTVPSTSPSEQPSAPEPEPDVLFTLSATVSALDGTPVAIQLVAHEPRVWSDPEIAGLADQFLERCKAGTGLTPIDADYLNANGATLMRIDFVSDSPDHQFASPIQLHFGNQFFPRAAFTDAVVTAQDDTSCYAGATWLFSNNAYAVSAFETGSSVPDTNQWQYGSYGFQLLPDSGTTIESCVKTITALGSATGVETVSGWDVTRDDGPEACGIGYIDDHDRDH